MVGLYAKPGGEFPDSSGAAAFVAVIDGKKGKLVEFVADAFFDDAETFNAIVDSLRFED